MDSSDEHELPPPVPTPSNPDDEDPSGGWWSDTWSSITDFWDSIGDFFGGALDFLVSPLTSIGDALEGFADGLLELKNSVSNFFSNFWSGLVGLFVPDDDYFSNFFDEIKEEFSIKWGGVLDLVEGLKDGLNQFLDSEFQGIKINFNDSFLPVSGEYYIIEPAPINFYAERFKFWTSGLMIFLTAVYALKKILQIIRGVQPL